MRNVNLKGSQQTECVCVGMPHSRLCNVESWLGGGGCRTCHACQVGSSASLWNRNRNWNRNLNKNGGGYTSRLIFCRSFRGLAQILIISPQNAGKNSKTKNRKQQMARKNNTTNWTNIYLGLPKINPEEKKTFYKWKPCRINTLCQQAASYL